MHQTLFIIEPWIFQGPLLVAWIIVGCIVLAYTYSRHGMKQETLSFIPVFVIVAVVIHFVLPYLMIQGTNPEDPNGKTIPIGLAIRGYGVMMLLAILAGVGVAIARATQVGISAEKLVSLAFWTIVCGIAGARIIYVVQYGGRFQADTFVERIRLMIDMTRGGLVVYGSLIGGMIATVVLTYVYKFKYWLLVDVLAPAFMIGLGIGRIGCLLNGCCFGGDCEVQWAAVRFPAGSPPYMRQLETGQLLGINTAPNSDDQPGRIVQAVDNNSLGAELGITVGEIIQIRHEGDRVFRDRIQHKIPIDSRIQIVSVGKPDRFLDISRFESEPYDRSQPIHPTQVYSAINGLLIAGILFFAFPFRARNGDLFALLLILYPMTRFLLEYVRTDEFAIDPNGWFTISQWVSIGMIVLGVAILLAFRARPVATMSTSGSPTDP